MADDTLWPPTWLNGRDWHQTLLFMHLFNTSPSELRDQSQYDEQLLARLDSLSDAELKSLILELDPELLTTSVNDFFGLGE